MDQLKESRLEGFHSGKLGTVIKFHRS